MARLDDKAALVTGAAAGIGAAVARALSQAGADVLLVDRDADALGRTAADIAAADTCCGRIEKAVLDVTEEAAMAAAVDVCRRRFGGLDIAILNAGIEGPVASIEDLATAEFDKVLAVNLRGVFLGLKASIPAMRQRGGGAIVITSSVAGIVGTAGLAPYTTSKHGVIGLMRSAALELAGDNIRVNTVNPCPVETRMMRAIETGMRPDDRENAYRAFTAAIPAGRYAKPEDVAAMMLFLASDEAAFLTGGVYMVDGGMTAGLVGGGE